MAKATELSKYGVAALALKIFKTRRTAYEKFDEDVDQWYRQGDGRPSREGGRGYAYPSCIHGTSHWTDYDNICGPCEDGYGYFDPMRERRDALDEATYAYKEGNRRMALVGPVMAEMHKARTTSDSDRAMELAEWAWEPVTRLTALYATKK